jgi:hypothetical protein
MRDQVRGKTDFDIHTDEVAEAVRANDRQVIEAGAPMQFEEAVPSVEGERSYISSKFLLRDRKGNPYAVCGIATDITELKRAEAMQARRARQAFLRADIQLAFSEAAESGLQTVLQWCTEAVVRHLTRHLHVSGLSTNKRTCLSCGPAQVSTPIWTAATLAYLSANLRSASLHASVNPT